MRDQVSAQQKKQYGQDIVGMADTREGHGNIRRHTSYWSINDVIASFLPVMYSGLAILRKRSCLSAIVVLEVDAIVIIAGQKNVDSCPHLEIRISPPISEDAATRGKSSDTFLAYPRS